MTRDKAIEKLTELKERSRKGIFIDEIDALNMAIKALSQEPTDTWSIKDVANNFKKHGLIREQEPCDDAVSRQAVINAIENDCMRGGLGSCFASYDDAQKFRGEIEKLPSVTQKEVTDQKQEIADDSTEKH